MNWNPVDLAHVLLFSSIARLLRTSPEDSSERAGLLALGPDLPINKAPRQPAPVEPKSLQALLETALQERPMQASCQRRDVTAQRRRSLSELKARQLQRTSSGTGTDGIDRFINDPSNCRRQAVLKLSEMCQACYRRKPGQPRSQPNALLLLP